MTPAIREQARLAVLRYLDAAADSAPGRGISTAVLSQHLRAEGFVLAPGEDPATPTPKLFAVSICRYLQGKGLVGETTKAVSPEVTEWIITSAGRDEYARLAGAD